LARGSWSGATIKIGNPHIADEKLLGVAAGAKSSNGEESQKELSQRRFKKRTAPLSY